MKMGTKTMPRQAKLQLLSDGCRETITFGLSMGMLSQESRIACANITLNETTEKMAKLLEPQELGILCMLYQNGSRPSGIRYDKAGVECKPSDPGSYCAKMRDLFPNLTGKAMFTAIIQRDTLLVGKSDFEEIFGRLERLGLIESYLSDLLAMKSS